MKRRLLLVVVTVLLMVSAFAFTPAPAKAESYSFEFTCDSAVFHFDTPAYAVRASVVVRGSGVPGIAVAEGTQVLGPSGGSGAIGLSYPELINNPPPVYPDPRNKEEFMLLELMDSSFTVIGYGIRTAAVCNRGGFSGPGLPDANNRNLVLVLKETALYDAAGGTFIDQTIKACKTVFIIDVSADGKWGLAFTQGGWLKLADTIDVGEDYGQPGGDSYAPCAGK